MMWKKIPPIRGKRMKIDLLSAYNYEEEIRELFSEYTHMLIQGDASFKQYLEIQNYEEELRNLEDKYGYPKGRLYLAFCDGTPAGCVGLKKIDDKNCEMKRLYVRPRFRGNHLGDLLIGQIVKDAGEIGYSFMLLDTLPFLKSALHLYQKWGFCEVPCYNDSPMDTSIYMKLAL